MISKTIVTMFGLGLFPKAPGTMGSLGAVLIWALVHYLWATPLTAYALIGGAFILNFIFVPLYLKHTKKKDPQEVVIDEVLGQWIALIGTGSNPLFILLAFILFRAFDIFKPWPIHKIDALGGSHFKNTISVIFDDVAAGLCAMILIYLSSILLQSNL